MSSLQRSGKGSQLDSDGNPIYANCARNCELYDLTSKSSQVQTMGPVSTSPTGEDREYLQYVISGARRPIYVGGNFTGGRRPGGQQPYSPLRPIPTTTTTTQRSNIPNYLGNGDKPQYVTRSVTVVSSHRPQTICSLSCSVLFTCVL